MFGISSFSQSPFSTLGGGGVVNVAAEVISTSSVVTNANLTSVVSADSSSSSSITVSAILIKSAQADIQSSSNFQASAVEIILCSANISLISILECNTNLITNVSAFLLGNSSITASARLKWEDSNLVTETWTAITDQSESWTDVSEQSESWTVTT